MARVQLTVVQGRPLGRSIMVTGPLFRIGRDTGCQLRPTSAMVSRVHAEILVRSEAVFIHDLDSRNGTWVNGEELTGPVQLQSGDLIQIGPPVFAIAIQTGPAGPPPRPPGRAGARRSRK